MKNNKRLEKYLFRLLEKNDLLKVCETCQNSPVNLEELELIDDSGSCIECFSNFYYEVQNVNQSN